MKKIIGIFILLSTLCIDARAQKSNEVALFVRPLKLDNQESYSLLYRRQLQSDNWSLRAGFNTLVVFDKEWRGDSVSSNTGNVSFSISAGVQRSLELGELSKWKGYVATDVYWNSSFVRGATDTYYGYFWNTGLRPSVGLTYEPLSNIRMSIESRSDFNVNLQGYNAEGVNRDVRYSFRPMNELVIGIGYLF